VSSRPDELSAVDGVGDVIAHSILDWWATRWHQDIVSSWRDAGVSFEDAVTTEGSVSGTLAGLAVVVTGAIPRIYQAERGGRRALSGWETDVSGQQGHVCRGCRRGRGKQKAKSS